MNRAINTIALAAGILLSQLCVAQAPAGAPAGTTGLCNDGTYYTGATKQGACRGHKGVKDWYGATAATPSRSSVAPASSASTSASPSASTAAPAGATGLCNDGTYYTGATKKGACRGHKGVKDWYGAIAATPSKPSGATAAPTQAAAPAAPAPVGPTKTAANATTPAPGGGSGQVWLNTATKVYHCEGSRYYGKTKAGAYMSEADAKAKGARPDHGKPCQ